MYTLYGKMSYLSRDILDFLDDRFAETNYRLSDVHASTIISPVTIVIL
jgi:hypothetical protein